MQISLQKWGHSLGIRIPIQLARQLHLHVGSPINIEIEDGRLILQPPQYDLDTMLESITPKNRHHPLLDDSQLGEEEW